MITQTSIALGGLVLMVPTILLVDQTLVPAALVSIVLAVAGGWIYCWKKGA